MLFSFLRVKTDATEPVDPAVNLCRWRTLGLFLEAQKVQETVELLEKLDIRSSDILIITKDPTPNFPPVNWIPVTWGLPGLGGGLLLGIILGLAAGLVWGGTAWFILPLWSGLGAILGWQVGMRQPRPLLKPFWRDVQQGSYLVLIYATAGAHQRVLHPVRRSVGNLYETRVLSV